MRINILAALLVLAIAASMVLADGAGEPENTVAMVANDYAPGTPVMAAAPVVLSGPNLSLMISRTRPISGLCGPIDGKKAHRLDYPIQAQVYFSSKGWVSGYLIAGETVYATPCGDGWYEVTHTVRCGNPARGRFHLEEAVRVVEKTLTVIEKVPCQLPPLGPLPAVIPSQPLRLETVRFELVDVRGAAQPICIPAPIAAYPKGAVAFGQPGEHQERVIGGVAGVPRQHQESSKPPPPDDTCGPGSPGPKPPPNSGPPGNPSGPIPCPPGSDPNRPPDQPDHGTGGQLWDPSPSNPHVADPVVLGQ